MQPPEEHRPDPDALLNAIKRDEENRSRARLKIFFGMSAGVGKTYDMLKAAHDAKAHGVDVVVGIVETHGRRETEALVTGLTIVPRKQVDYKGARLEEMDLDGILARKPKLVLVDELAHSNAPGSRHTKRYMDVEELLDSGIDVYTTLNVQHLESRADAVAQITGSIVRETVPDSVLERADEVELIDISPDELLERLAEGKVYTPDRSSRAIENFFRKGNLTALREMSLRLTAERVDRQLRDYMRSNRIQGPWKSGQRLLVGISGSPHSVQLIRWARRMAFTQDASWVALHVESSVTPTQAEQELLTKNITLARSLGAEFVSTSDVSVTDALVRVARQENCTQILIGKPRRGHFQRSAGLLQELIDKSGDLDVHVIGGEGSDEQERRRWSLLEVQSGIRHYLAAGAVPLLVAAACFPLSGIIEYQTVALVLLFTVALLPLRFGIGPVLLAATLSAVVWDYLFIPPLFTFSVSRVPDILMLLMYFGIALVLGILTSRTRAQERAVRQRESRAVALYTLSRDLSVARTKDAVAEAAIGNVQKFFDADVVLFLGQTDGDIFTAAHPASTLAVGEKEMGVAAWVYWNEKPAGRFTDTLPSAAATYFPISGPRYPLGVLGVRLRGEKNLTNDQEALLENFVRQIASAIERETLNELTKKAVVVEESERLYKTLFNSISHEMRTPLSAIMGTSESLLDDRVAERPGARKELIGEIHEAASRLNRLVENLLDMTRLESGLIRPKLDWCDLADLVNSALSRTKQELAGFRLEVNIPADIVLLKIDFALMEQVLTNLLLNASLYTPAGSTIGIRAGSEGNECVIEVEDNGPGLPPEVLEKVFDKFFRAPGSRTGGTGLGLSIARGFVEAHRGTIRAENRPAGGLKFIIRLPLERYPAPEAE
ncbi:MAG TPA: sensor histidine kinase KdpD [Bacteroidota bacterium]|nr:sensor histidine kinase KdpD [Bacteroidota bacterium]